MNKGIVGLCATSKKAVRIMDAYQDSRFNIKVDKETGFRTRNILCTPIFRPGGDLIGVMQMLNKKGWSLFLCLPCLVALGTANATPTFWYTRTHDSAQEDALISRTKRSYNRCPTMSASH